MITASLRTTATHALRWVDGTFYCGDRAARAAVVTARAAVKDRKLLCACA
jgi:transposase